MVLFRLRGATEHHAPASARAGRGDDAGARRGRRVRAEALRCPDAVHSLSLLRSPLQRGERVAERVQGRRGKVTSSTCKR